MSRSGEALPSLIEARREIEEIDRALVLLVAARVEAACSAIRIRREMDGQISNPAQEEVVIGRARGWAEPAGLSPDLVEAIFRAVLAAGKDRYGPSSHGPRAALAEASSERGAGRTRRKVPTQSNPNARAEAGTPIST